MYSLFGSHYSWHWMSRGKVSNFLTSQNWHWPFPRRNSHNADCDWSKWSSSHGVQLHTPQEKPTAVKPAGCNRKHLTRPLLCSCEIPNKKDPPLFSLSGPAHWLPKAQAGLRTFMKTVIMLWSTLHRDNFTNTPLTSYGGQEGGVFNLHRNFFLTHWMTLSIFHRKGNEDSRVMPSSMRPYTLNTKTLLLPHAYCSMLQPYGTSFDFQPPADRHHQNKFSENREFLETMFNLKYSPQSLPT